MAKQYDNSGALSRAEKKPGGSPNQPELRGSISVTCPGCGESHDFWMSGWAKSHPNWIKDHNPEGKYVSISIQPKDKSKQQDGGSRPGQRTDYDDDLPF